MESGLQKKYGLFTAISMVVGIVIGSGVFFKAGKVLKNANGDMGKCLLTVGIVGAIMLVCAYVFSILAQRYERVNGIVDYSEVSLGTGYGYAVGWFLTTIYYPTLVSCLAWISADYTCVLFGWAECSDLHLVIAAFYLICGYAVNALSPKLAGYFQVSATVIKLIPLVTMAIVGTIAGLCNGMTIEAFSASSQAAATSGENSIMAAIVAFAFAYEGWIIATSINAELKNSKRNLPIALTVGSIIVIAIYLAYFLGLTGVLSTDQMMNPVKNVPMDAFSALFGNEVFGSIVFVFIIISCLGTMNGLMLGCCRGMYSVAVRGQGPAVKVFNQVDEQTNMPTNSSTLGLVFCAFWLLQWELGDVVQGLLPSVIAWENDELPIITLYAAYIPIFVVLMKNGKDLNVFKRFIMPGLAIGCCCFMVYCAFAAYKIQAVYYLIVFAIVMVIGLAFYRNANGVPVYKRVFGKN